MSSDDLRSWMLATQREYSPVAMAKLLTTVEQFGPRAFACEEILNPKHLSFRIGITGPPGAGKSTLIGQVLNRLSRVGKRVGVIAIDPTSPISQGAILGDRIRYSDQSLNSNVFIRSLGSRGSLGGLAAHAYLLARAFDACDFDITIVETVGVGQVEVDVMNVADAVVLVLVPESGDSVQAMKAGITEVADLVVVNKSDRPGAELLRREIEAQLNKSVLAISATENLGVELLMEWLASTKANGQWREKRFAPNRLRAEAIALKRDEIEKQILKTIDQIETPDALRELFS